MRSVVLVCENNACLTHIGSVLLGGSILSRAPFERAAEACRTAVPTILISLPYATSCLFGLANEKVTVAQLSVISHSKEVREVKKNLNAVSHGAVSVKRYRGLVKSDADLKMD